MCRAILLALCVVSSSTTMGQGILSRLVGGRRDWGKMEERYREVKGERIGKYLAGEHAGKRVLVLVWPKIPAMDGQVIPERPHVAVVRGLKRGMKGMVFVGVLQPKFSADVAKEMAGPAGARMPFLEMWFGVEELNQELLPYKGKYDILVCLARLPGVRKMTGVGWKTTSYKELSFWQEKRVSVVVAEGSIAQFEDLIKAGKVCAAVVGRQGLQDEDYQKPPARNLNKAFNTRLILITPQNVGKHSAYFIAR